MKKILFILLFFLIFLVNFNSVTYAEIPKQINASSIDVKYTVVPKGDYFKVKADLTNITEPKIIVEYNDSYVGMNKLSKRIVDFQALSPAGMQLSVVKTKHDFLVNTNGLNAITLQYQFHPHLVKHDHHLATLTNTYLHIPGEDFAFQVLNKQDKRLLTNDLFKIKLTGLPKRWEPLHTYSFDQNGYIIVPSYHEALIHAGEYQRYNFSLGGSEFMIAVDKASQFDIKPLIGDIQKILHYHYQTFGRVPAPKILIVINQIRNANTLGFSLGGQVKNYNIINDFGGINKSNQKLFKIPILGHIVHESFHLWMAGDFNVADNWSWFWEGLTDYQKYRVLKNLGIITQREFENYIRDDSYAGYYRNQYRDELSLVEISKEKGDFSKYSSLLYDKGAMVAYLFDQELQRKNSNIDIFLKQLYHEYGVPKKPLGTDELIKIMETALGDSTFTGKYILGTAPLPFHTPCWFKFYAIVKNYLPPIPFPWDVWIPMITIIFILLIIYLGVKFIIRKTRKIRESLIN